MSKRLDIRLRGGERMTNLEKETIVNFNEEENVAQVYTFNKALQNRLNRLAVERPEECQVDSRFHGSAAVAFLVPKKWIAVRPPRCSGLTAEQRAEKRERMRAFRAAQLGRAL